MSEADRKHLTKTEAEFQSEIEALKRQISELKQSRSMLEAILDNAPVLISVRDLNGTYRVANHRYDLLRDLSAAEIIGKNIHDLFPFEAAEELWHGDRDALRAGRPLETEEKMQHCDGSCHTYYSVRFPLRDEQQAAFGVCSISIDITERKQAQERSIRDELTGLFNRRHFNTVYPEQLARARREQRNFVFLMLDLDCFKKYNDTYGHQKGDEVLAAIGQVLTRSLKRYGDFSFRIGGEEFACLFTVREPEHARVLADHIRQAVEELQIQHEGNLPGRHVTLSIGMAVIGPEDDYSAEQIFNFADEALYQAKSEGRNRICQYELVEA